MAVPQSSDQRSAPKLAKQIEGGSPARQRIAGIARGLPESIELHPTARSGAECPVKACREGEIVGGLKDIAQVGLVHDTAFDPHLASFAGRALPAHAAADRPAIGIRSEEHTSELQSLMRISYAVF